MSSQIFNHSQLIQRYGSGANLGDIFLQIETDLKQNAEVVCQFKVNGLALDEQSEKRLSQSSLNEVELLEVFSQKPAAILVDILGNWKQKIPMMLKQNDQLAADIRFKGFEGHMKSMVELIDDCQLLVDSIISIDALFTAIPFLDSNQWKNAQNQMASGIGEAIQAFQKKDYTLLADILEYDLGHSLQVWLEMLGLLQQSVNDTNVENSFGLEHQQNPDSAAVQDGGTGPSTT